MCMDISDMFGTKENTVVYLLGIFVVAEMPHCRLLTNIIPVLVCVPSWVNRFHRDFHRHGC